MSNFDLIDAVKKLPIKHFRGVFMKDQLPAQPKIPETGIINLDDNTGPGTHWVGYAIYTSSINYFDSYGLPPPREFINYVRELSSENSRKMIPIWYSTLPTHTLNDPPICGQEVLNALTAISTSSKLPYKAVHEYTMMKIPNHLKEKYTI